jgi:type IV secretory pathway VirB4 component
MMDSFEYLLPYLTYDPDGMVFILKDGAIGVAWRLQQIDLETTDDTGLSHISSQICSLLQRLPGGVHTQFLYSIGPLAKQDNILTEGCLSGFLKKCYLENLCNQDLIFCARKTDLIFTIKLPLKLKTPGLSSMIKSLFGKKDDFERFFLKQYNARKRKLLRIAGVVEQFFRQIQIDYLRLCDSELYQFVQTFSGRPFDNLTFKPEEGVISINRKFLAVLSLCHLPPFTFPGMVLFETESGDSFLDHINEGVFVISSYRYYDEEAQSFLRMKKRLAAWQLSGGIESKEEIAVGKKEIDQALLGMYSEGYVLYNNRINVIIKADDPEILNLKVEHVKNSATKRQLEFVQEDYYAMQIFFQSLPFGFEQTGDTFLKRGRKMLSVNLADMVPIFGHYRGNSGAGFIFVNRRRQEVNFSFFDNNVAPHGMIVGTSGSGKSFLCNFLITHVVADRAKVFVVDRGNSYQKLCHLFKGKYVVADPDNPVCINPLYGVYSNELNISATGFVIEAITQGKRDLSTVEHNLISEAIKNAYKSKTYFVNYNDDSEIEKYLMRYFVVKRGKNFVFKGKRAWGKFNARRIFKVGDENGIVNPVSIGVKDGYKLVIPRDIKQEEALLRSGARATDYFVINVKNLEEFLKVCSSGYTPQVEGGMDLERYYKAKKTQAVFQGEVFLSDVRHQLELSGNPKTRELALCLLQFTGDGAYAKFFDGKNQVFFEGSDLFVFELGQMALRVEISTCLLLAILQNIANYCSTTLDKRKYFFIDEAWSLLRSENTAVFIENAFRTYRKYATSCIVITQQPHDLLNSKAGLAILANSPNRIFLRLPSEVINQITDVFSFNRAKVERLLSLRTLKGMYSEMLIDTDGTGGVVRLIPDKASYWVYTSDAQDNARLYECIKMYLGQMDFEGAVCRAVSDLSGIKFDEEKG